MSGMVKTLNPNENVVFLSNSTVCQTGLCCSETCSKLLGLPDTIVVRFGLFVLVLFFLKAKKKIQSAIHSLSSLRKKNVVTQQEMGWGREEIRPPFRLLPHVHFKGLSFFDTGKGMEESHVHNK